ncbi:hypothetical protein F4677DRAFT_409705 [Hypoxylon crocopeplum]|nr:hypothetical protein F4677DRAFT_409705 [Hypoxylon crocopeplum]
MATSDRRAKVPEAIWGKYKDEIIDLYLAQDLKLKDLADRMRGRLDASPSQFEAQLKAWSVRKNLKAHEWKFIFKAIDKLPEGTKSRVIISGQPAPDLKIHRAQRNYKISGAGNSKRRRLNDESEEDEAQTINDIEDVSIQILRSDGTWYTFPTTRHGESIDTYQITESCSAIEQVDTYDDSNHDEHWMSALERNADLLLESQTGANSELQLYTGVSSALQSTDESSDWISNSSLLAPVPSVGWLKTLPSEHLFEIGSNIQLANSISFRTIPNPIQSTRSIIFQFLVAISSSEESSGILSQEQPGPLFLLRTITAWAQETSFGDKGFIPANRIDETKFVFLILRSALNGFAGLCEIEPDHILRFLQRFQSLNWALIHLLKTSRSRAAQSLAESLFPSAIELSDAPLVRGLLSTGLLDVNNIIIHGFRGVYTPVERAASLGSPDVIKVLLEYNADVNRSYPRKSFGIRTCDPVLEFLRSDAFKSGIISDMEAIIDILLAAGAKVYSSLINRGLGQTNPSIATRLLERISQDDHPKSIREGFLESLVFCWDDDKCTELVSRIIRDCKARHNEKCFLVNPNRVDRALAVGASRGSFALVKLLLPYSTETYKVLSCAIRSGRSDLIDLVLEQKPDLFPRTIESKADLSLYWLSSGPFTDPIYSPLAEAILAGNEPLIRSLEEAGALAHLDGWRLQPIITAASEVGNAAYVRKLLSHYPSPTPEELTGAFGYAIRNNDQSLTSELLEAGAAIHGSPIDKIDPLVEVIKQRNGPLVRDILSADIQDSRIDFGAALKCGDKSIIMDLINTSPTILLPEDPYREEVPTDDPLGSADKDIFSFVLERRSATREVLTFALRAAIEKQDIITIQELLRKGGDPSRLVEFAAKTFPSAVDVLITQITNGIRPVINESAMPALAAAIRGGPKCIATLDALLQSGLFTLERECLFEAEPILSPLGLAIRQTKRVDDPSFLVIERLLTAGCNVNSIAQYTEAKGIFIGQSALLVAIEANNDKLVQLLINRGADVNAEAVLSVKRTPLQRASEVGNLNIVKMLLKYGANVNGKSAARSGGTALQLAAISGSCKIALELLAHGALLHYPPKVNGRWPLEGAAENGRLDMIELLWRANGETIITTLPPHATGFELDCCRRAMRLAEKNLHFACRDLISDLLTQRSSQQANLLS